MTTLLTGSGTPSSLFNGHREQVYGPPGKTKDHWAGAPSAIVHDGSVYLAFRYRGPDRGMSTVIAKSTDGLVGRHFEKLLTIKKEDWENRWGQEIPLFSKIDSFERPALLRTKEGRWQLWTCTALPRSTNGKDWSTQIQEADTIAELVNAKPRKVFGGEDKIAYKDPVPKLINGVYYVWMCAHELYPRVDWDQEDGNYTEVYASHDTHEWEYVPEADIRPVEGTPFSHGTRVGDVVYIPGMGKVAVFVDGKASSNENKKERTFLWTGASLLGPYAPVSETVLGQSEDPEQPGLRYATVAMSDGSPIAALYYELSSSVGNSLQWQPLTRDGLAMSLSLTAG